MKKHISFLLVIVMALSINVYATLFVKHLIYLTITLIKLIHTKKDSFMTYLLPNGMPKM